jgi:hypothetical protein
VLLLPQAWLAVDTAAAQPLAEPHAACHPSFVGPAKAKDIRCQVAISDIIL